jgi:hypothetical protein
MGSHGLCVWTAGDRGVIFHAQLVRFKFIPHLKFSKGRSPLIFLAIELQVKQERRIATAQSLNLQNSLLSKLGDRQVVVSIVAIREASFVQSNHPTQRQLQPEIA